VHYFGKKIKHLKNQKKVYTSRGETRTEGEGIVVCWIYF